MSPDVTVSLTNRRNPAEKSFIEPDGSVTSPEGLRHTVRISRLYDGRCDQSSNGAPCAITRSPMSVKTCLPKANATTRSGAQSLIGDEAGAASAGREAEAAEGSATTPPGE